MNESAAEYYAGQQFGLPEDGLGSVASVGRRVLAFLIDLLVAFGVALAFTSPVLPKNWALLVWAVMTVTFVGTVGYTPGQFMMGIRVAPLRGRMVGLWAIPRTVLTFLIIPAALYDRDGRGVHDRLCRTVVIRAR